MDKKDSRKIPLSEVIYVDIDDEIGTIFDRIKSKTSHSVYLVIPSRSVIFQSIINVRILKRKAEDLEKKISFITKDKSGIFFAGKCKIDVYENVNLGRKITSPEDITEQLFDEKPDASKSQRPSVKGKEKISIAEITANGRYETFALKVKKIAHKIWKKKTKEKQIRSLLGSRPNKNLLITLILGSVFILFLISYIALPNATAYLKPNQVPIEQATNVTFADAVINEGLLRTKPNKVIESYKIDPGMLEKTMQFNSTGNDATGSNSKGSIVIQNKSAREFPLKPFTRFQTDDGLIFRSQNFIVIPPGTENIPGQLEIKVVADETDVNGLPIGARGNINANTKFFIPGLTDTPREIVYATAKANFTGGISSKDKIVTQRDIDSAKEFTKKELLKDVSTLLNDYLVRFNTENNLNLSLLNDLSSIKIGEPEIVVDETIVGLKMPTFSVTARVTASGIGFNEADFIEILRGQIRRSPDKALTKIDENGVTYRVVKVDEEKGLIEVTGTVTGVETYELSEDKESGQRIIKKIKDHIAGLPVAEAEKYIENLPEIENADIKTWPFWSPTVPSRPENIKIVINE